MTSMVIQMDVRCGVNPTQPLTLLTEHLFLLIAAIASVKFYGCLCLHRTIRAITWWQWQDFKIDHQGLVLPSVLVTYCRSCGIGF
jgi:hypothetical protein